MSPEVQQPEHERQPESLTLEHVSEFAKEIALEIGGHVPTLIVQASDRRVMSQLAEMPDTHEERLQLMLAAGLVMGTDSSMGELEQVFFIAEGWLSITSMDRAYVLPPAADPDRKEVLFISNLKVQEHKASLAVFEMVREGEVLVALQPLEAASEAPAHGVNAPLLDAFVAGYRRGASGKRN